MERNQNEQVVTIAVELYQQLVQMAQSGSPYNASKITRHARKFNPHLQPAHRERVIKKERKRTEMIREARAFKEAHCGKIVYAAVDMRSFTEGTNPVFTKVKVMNISKDRRLVNVCPVNDGSAIKHKHYTPVSANTLHLEIPEHYIEGVGAYSKYMVEPNGPYDLREAVAERKRKEEAEEKAYLARPKPGSSQAFDVIGEQ